jgi:hypothetical protein
MKHLSKSPTIYIVGFALLFITTFSVAQNTGDEIIAYRW